MMNEFKVLLNKKVVGIGNCEIYFEDGYSLSISQYETYLEKYSKENVNKDRLCYFSPGYFK